MLTIAPPIFRKRRGRVKRKPLTVAPPAPLTLVAASYDPDGPIATLTFDRAVSVAGFDGSQVTVNDPLSLSSLFDATGGATLVSPTVVQVTLVPSGLPSGEAVTLSATAMTGIVATNDGGAWAGATDLELPFP